MEIADFKGLVRDAVPEGDRIFALPYFDEKGRHTICQWNTASQGTDYRIGPRETKIENYQWTMPKDIPAGKVTIKAVLNFCRVVKSVAEFMELPPVATDIIVVNTVTSVVTIAE